MRFIGQTKNNYVVPKSGNKELQKFRIRTIRNELGGRTTVNYGHMAGRDCDKQYVEHGHDGGTALKAWESEKYCRDRLGLPRALGSIDRAKLNVKGGSVAVGHPFAATGARIVATLGKLLATRGSGRGLISVCTAGGMGVTAIMER